MTPDDIKKIIETVIDNKTKHYWLYLLLAIIIGIGSSYFYEYLKEKGKNLATKADIEELTQKVEDVKSEYIKQIEIFKGNQQLKNSKKKELYDKVEELRTLIIVGKNEKKFNEWGRLTSLMKDIMILISANTIFTNLSPERDKINNDYNNMVRQAEIQGNNLSINFDSTAIALESIQSKLME